MENNLNEELKRNKLILSYKLGKTLQENMEDSDINASETEIDEQGVLRDIASVGRDARTLKGVNPELFRALNDVLRFGSAEGKTITGFRNATATQKGVIRNVEELLSAVKRGLDPADEGRFLTGLLKSPKTPVNFVNSIAKDLVSSDEFIKRYAEFADEAALRTELLNRKYSQASIDSIVNETKVNRSFLEGKAAAMKAGKTGVAGAIGNLSTNIKTKLLKLFNTGKLAAKWKAIFTALGITAGGMYLSYKIFGPNTTPDDVKKMGIPKCVLDLLELNDSYTAPTTGGDPVIMVPKTGNPQYDQLGGLKFYTNKRVYSMDGVQRGTWSCKTTLSEIYGDLLHEQVAGNLIDNVSITWDGQGATNPNPGPTPNPAPRRSIYHNCTEFPFVQGCRNTAIQEIQVCFGFPQKYQTGNFGPITIKGLQDHGYDVTNGITREIYTAVKSKCGQTTPAPVEPTPAPIPGSELQDTGIPPTNIPNKNALPPENIA